MLGKDGSGPAPVAEEEEFSLFHAISQELTQVPEQKQPINQNAISPDIEGMRSLNSLPEIALSGSKRSSKWEEEDGVIRSGKAFFFFFFLFLCLVLAHQAPTVRLLYPMSVHRSCCN